MIEAINLPFASTRLCEHFLQQTEKVSGVPVPEQEALSQGSQRMQGTVPNREGREVLDCTCLMKAFRSPPFPGTWVAQVDTGRVVYRRETSARTRKRRHLPRGACPGRQSAPRAKLDGPAARLTFQAAARTQDANYQSPCPPRATGSLEGLSVMPGLPKERGSRRRWPESV